ncbi:MAG: glycosyltransferase family 2 protein [Promethearchaeota archaeon]
MRVLQPQNAFVSIVVVTHNRPVQLKESLNSLKRQNLSNDLYEILVVDSSATNETKAIVKDFPAKYVHTKHKGMTVARNIGIIKAKGEIIAFIDDDAIADKDWVRQILKNYNRAKIGAVGGKVIEDRPLREKRRKIGSLIGKISKTGELISNFDLGINKIETDHIKGTNMSFMKKNLIEIGGFDNLYGGRAYREETDVCMRLKKRGYRIIFDPKTKVFHKRIGPKSSHVIKKNIVIEYWRARNHAYFYFKNIFSSNVRHFLGFLHAQGNAVISRARERQSILASFYYFVGALEGCLLSFLARPYHSMRSFNAI